MNFYVSPPPRLHAANYKYANTYRKPRVTITQNFFEPVFFSAYVFRLILSNDFA